MTATVESDIEKACKKDVDVMIGRMAAMFSIWKFGPMQIEAVRNALMITWTDGSQHALDALK